MTFDKTPFVWYFPVEGEDYRFPAIKIGDQRWDDPAGATLHVFTRTGIQLLSGVAPLARYESGRHSGKWDTMEEENTQSCSGCQGTQD